MDQGKIPVADFPYGRAIQHDDFLTEGVGAYHDDDNGVSSGSVYVFETPVTIVSIDIKPGDGTVALNSKGVLPVAILTTDDFDALTVDSSSVEFGPGLAHASRPGVAEDVDGDGDLDLLLHFRMQDTGVACGDSSASITGLTFDGEIIEGTDAFTTSGCP